MDAQHGLLSSTVSKRHVCGGSWSKCSMADQKTRIDVRMHAPSQPVVSLLCLDTNFGSRVHGPCLCPGRRTKPAPATVTQCNWPASRLVAGSLQLSLHQTVPSTLPGTHQHHGFGKSVLRNLQKGRISEAARGLGLGFGIQQAT